MPDVRMPDGTIIRNVPEGTTKAQLAARLQKAKPQQSGGILGKIGTAVSGINEMALGIPQGMENIAASITDPIAGLVFGKEATKQAQDARQGRWNTAQKAIAPRANPTARMVGQVGGAMAVPLPKVGFLGKIGNRALQGAAGGAAVRDSNQSAAAPAAIGAAANVVLPPLLSRAAQSKPVQALGRGVVRAAAPIFGASAKAPPPAPLAPLGRKAQARAARFKSLGIENPTTGMVTRDPAAISFEQNTARRIGGEDLARQLREVEAGLVEKGRSIVRDLGGAKGPEATGKAVEEVLDVKRGEMQQVTSRLYDKVRETRGDEPVGNLQSFRDFIGSPQVTDNATFDAMRESVGRRLKRFGPPVDDTPVANADAAVERSAKLADQIRGYWSFQKGWGHRREPIQVLVRGNGQIDGWVASRSGGNIRNKMHEENGDRLVQLSPDDETGLSGILDAAMKPRPSSGVTVAQAEELRKFIGGLGNGIEPSVRMMRRQMIDALDDDVVNAVGDDAFKAARASARARFEEFSKTFPGKLADEKLAPEHLTRRILGDGVKLSDLRSLKRSLTTGTPDQIARGTSALSDLRAQAVEELLGKAVDADGNLVGSTLAREFGKAAPKFRELLGPDEFKTLRRLAAATRDVKAYPVGHSVNTSNTAATLESMFSNAPTRVRDGWLGLLGRIGLRAGAHAVAAPAGPLGNVAVEGVRAAGAAAAASKAESAAAQALLEKIRLAQNPEAAAAAIAEAQAAASSSPAIADFLQQAGFGRLIGTGGRALGGSAGAAQQP